MKTLTFSKVLMLSTFAGLAFTSCSNDDVNDGGGVPNLPEISFNLEKTAVANCLSNDYVLGEYEEWYQKLMDFENQSDEQLQMNRPAYLKFRSKAPQKTDRGEAVSADEYEFVMQYLKDHPNEGSIEFNHYNYYMQLVGKSRAQYSATGMDGAQQEIVGSDKMDYFVIYDQNNKESEHCNDYNSGDGKRSLVLNKKITNASYHDSYGDNTYNHYKFYTIEYNGEQNMYLCFDYATHKDSGEDVQPDGVYDDWVIKVIPACDDEKTPAVDPDPAPVDPDPDPAPVDPDPDPAPVDPDPDPAPVDPDPEPTPVYVKKGEVEVNLSAQDHHDTEESKISIHVRDTVNFKAFIPVPVDVYCKADDMYIVEKHYGNMSYNEVATTLEREINGQKITLNITYAANGIYIESEGINAEALEYCRNVYGDGITFEVWNYYNTKKLNRAELIELLNQATIEFKDGEPGVYRNTKIEKNVDGAGNKLDCTVTKK